MQPPDISDMPYVVTILMPAIAADCKSSEGVEEPPTRTALVSTRCFNNFSSPRRARCNWVGTIAVKSALESTSTIFVPSSIDRTRTLTPAICVVGSSSDQRSPSCAPRYACDARADASNADAERATDFGLPVEPLVGITTAHVAGTSLNGLSPKARAGPSLRRAA